jgi:hypothetical protein
MRTLTIGLWLSSLIVAASACSGEPDEPPASPSAAKRLIEQVPPPLDLKAPPDDATKTGSGLVYKKLAANDTGAQPRGSDTALVRYTGWRQRTGDTFFTTKSAAQPMAIDVAHAAPGFREALQLLRKGERAVVWVPPSQGQGTDETLVYEVEVIDIVPPPAAASRAAGKG